MPVRWDPLLAAALSRELARDVEGARVRGILFDPERRGVLLFFGERVLSFEIHPLAGWVSWLPPLLPLPGAWTLKARVGGVRSLQDESVIAIELVPGRGRERSELVLEMVGNQWNAAIVEMGSGTIRHVLRRRGKGRRPLEVGARYGPPESTGRRSPHDADEWLDLMGAQDGSPQDLERRLLAQVAWTSSLNAPFLAGHAGWERWREMTTPETWGAFLHTTERGLQPYPVQLDGKAEAFPSLMEAFAAARARSSDAPSLHSISISSELVRRIERRILWLTSKLDGLRRQLATAADPAGLRESGDLILARFGQIPAGAARATLEGFHGEEREVVLDPSLPPAENAARYYDEAARAERASRTLPPLIKSTEGKVERWTNLLNELREGRKGADEVVRVLEAEGALGSRDTPGFGGASRNPTPRRPKGVRSARPTSLPYRRFRSSGGLEIRVGRNAGRNDELTFRHASPDDVWLHAGQSAGAHVILRWNRKDNPPAHDLAEAAALAALHSEARHSGSVAVTWTRRKHVRKPRRAPPGTVVAERVETLLVEPDARLLERLGWGNDGEPEADLP